MTSSCKCPKQDKQRKPFLACPITLAPSFLRASIVFSLYGVPAPGCGRFYNGEVGIHALWPTSTSFIVIKVSQASLLPVAAQKSGVEQQQDQPVVHGPASRNHVLGWAHGSCFRDVVFMVERQSSSQRNCRENKAAVTAA
ncbi:predicted protein [Coccidioides posadasii str. Silveira]|uniref:Predicted protein n=1 Tax=Coccidioides posadasii (strain RMSCC 757 / Silveira) TaxID=443226 RepID=E9CRP6_COCPS|nr:predicted protein [Coccidioides posadasii str. Silveira]